jgi:hypothetical protein
VGIVPLSAEEDLVFVAAAAVRISGFRVGVLKDSSVVAADGVDLNRFARLVVGGEVSSVHLTNVDASFVSEFFGAGIDETQRRRGTDHFFEGLVVDNEDRVDGSKLTSMLGIGRRYFVVELFHRGIDRHGHVGRHVSR